MRLGEGGHLPQSHTRDGPHLGSHCFSQECLWLYHMWDLVCSSLDYLGEAVISRQCQVMGSLCFDSWMLDQVRVGAVAFGKTTWFQILVCSVIGRWARGSIVLLDSPLWVIQRLGCWVGSSREVVERMWSERVARVLGTDLAIEAFFCFQLLQYSTFWVIPFISSYFEPLVDYQEK